MPKTIRCLLPLAAYLGMGCPAGAGWSHAYAGYGWAPPAVVLYGQYPPGPVRWRVYPRYHQTLYWPAVYRYPAAWWYSTGWMGCGC